MLRKLVALVVALVALPTSASAAPRAISETALRGFDFADPKCVEVERDVSAEAHPGKHVAVRPECVGPACSGKEADDEVGVVYFGERYLIPRIGRWASPDPLHVHAVGGGEALNSYHYIGGNLLQGRDPLGLTCGVDESCDASFEATAPTTTANAMLSTGEAIQEQPPTAPPVQAPRDTNRGRPATLAVVADELDRVAEAATVGQMEHQLDIRMQHSGGPSTPITDAVELYEFVVSIPDAIGGLFSDSATSVGVGDHDGEERARAQTRVLTAGVTALAAHELPRLNRRLQSQRGPRATLELANQIQGDTPLSAQTVSLLETAEGPTLVGAGEADLTVAQRALAESLGLTPAELPGFHGEQTVLVGASDRGLTPTRGVATNNVCGPRCGSLITDWGGTFEGKYFWFPSSGE